eukprot:167185-Prymnesium_polylepis.1
MSENATQICRGAVAWVRIPLPLTLDVRHQLAHHRRSARGGDIRRAEIARHLPAGCRDLHE